MEIKTMEEAISQRKKTNIWPWVLIVIVVLIVVGIVCWKLKKMSRVPEEEVEIPLVSEEKELPSDTTEEILKEVEAIEVLDLEKEFQEIDQDLNSL